MISDGFGDESPAEVAMRFQKWSHAVAGDMVNASSLIYDDLVQESLIHIWRLAEDKGDLSAVYLTKAARYRMMAIAGGKPMIGGDSTPGPKSRPTEVTVDWQAVAADNDDASTWGSLLEAADLLSVVELAYHEGEIVAALNGLKPEHRRFVYAKFWQGKTDTEIAAEMGVRKQLLGNWWTRTIRPALRDRLAHLAGAR